MTGFLRTLPDFAPSEVITTIGSPVSRNVLARCPSEASNSATWSRTHCCLLGTYSPWRVMRPTTPPAGQGFQTVVEEGALAPVSKPPSLDSFHERHRRSERDL